MASIATVEAFLNSARYNEAIVEAERMLAENPRSFPATLYLAIAYNNLRQYPRADYYAGMAADLSDGSAQEAGLLNKILVHRTLRSLMVYLRSLVRRVGSSAGGAKEAQADVSRVADTIFGLIGNDPVDAGVRAFYWPQVRLCCAVSLYLVAKSELQGSGLNKFLPARKRKVVDCCMFFNELDFLEFRLNALWDHVDHFIIVESPYTFSGKAKSLVFQENRDRFSPFLDKISYVSGDQTLLPSAWHMEDAQRDLALRGVNALDLASDDVVIFSDLDEIPRPEVIADFSRNTFHDLVSLNLETFYYFMNVKVPAMAWAGPYITTVELAKRIRPSLGRELIKGHSREHAYDKAGWHFTWLGGAEKIIEKIEASAHEEFDNAENKSVSSIVGKLRDIKPIPGTFTGDLGELTVVDIDSEFPPALAALVKAADLKGWLCPSTS